MISKARFWNTVLVVLSGVNLAAVWFAAQPGEPWHATLHAGLSLGFGLWAQRRIRPGESRAEMGALGQGAQEETAELRDEVGDVRRELGEVQERLDFTERMLTQARQREADPPSNRGEV